MVDRHAHEFWFAISEFEEFVVGSGGDTVCTFQSVGSVVESTEGLHFMNQYSLPGLKMSYWTTAPFS